MDLQRSHGPAQKLGTQLRGIVDAQGQPAAHSGAYNAHTHRIKHFKGGLYRAGQAGHNAAQNGALYLLGGNVVQRKHAAYSSAVAAFTLARRAENKIESFSKAPSVMLVLPMFTVRIMEKAPLYHKFKNKMHGYIM